MGRILSIDYGLKRTGIAVTDPLKIIASPFDTVQSKDLLDWLSEYKDKENVERIVVGMPTNLDQSNTHMTAPVDKLIELLKAKFPDIPISHIDERFTSKLAQQAMVIGGMKKKERQKKQNVDKVSAAIILQSYLDRKQ